MRASQIVMFMLAAMSATFGACHPMNTVTVPHPLMHGYPPSVIDAANDAASATEPSQFAENEFVATPLEVRAVDSGVLVFVLLAGRFTEPSLTTNPASTLMKAHGSPSYNNRWISLGASGDSLTPLDGLVERPVRAVIGYDLSKDESEYIGKLDDGRVYFIAGMRSSTPVVRGSRVLVHIYVDELNGVFAARGTPFMASACSLRSTSLEVK